MEPKRKRQMMFRLAAAVPATTEARLRGKRELIHLKTAHSSFGNGKRRCDFGTPFFVFNWTETKERATSWMMKSLSLFALCAAFFSVSPVIAQQKPRISPSDTVSATIDGTAVKIVYSRPYTKDPKTGEPRKIWGGLVPFGKVWRTGANEATLLTTEKPIEIGGQTIPAGTYSLFTVPEENGGKLVINKQTGQWGTKYDEKQDLVRVDLKKEPLNPAVHQFTMAIEKSEGGGVLKLMWEDSQYSVPFTIKK